MVVHRGVVRGNTIILSEPADLPDGAEVEVRLTDAACEDAFERRLYEVGLLGPNIVETPSRSVSFEPLRLDGEPVSETIIWERR